MGSIVKFSETRCGLRKRPTRYTPEMASASDLRKLRALYEGDPAEAFQREQARALEAAGRRLAARID
jgi:hypothetical protein